MESKRILVLIEWFLPGEQAGGPVRTLAAVLEHFGHRAHFLVVTRNRDFGDEEPYPGIESGRWRRLGPAQAIYLSRSDESIRSIGRMLRSVDHDLLYINTLYSAGFSLYPLLLRKLRLVPQRSVIVAPRGQLNPGALRIRPVKKRVFLYAARVARLFAGVRWQATSAEEADNIRRWFGKGAEVVLAPNLRSASKPPEVLGEVGKRPLRLVFFSRVTAMKNLVGALEILQGVRSPVEFSIYGFREDPAYWARCEALMSRLPANVSVSYRGVVSFADAHSTLAAHDILLLPTKGENYGHVIAEALAAGCAPLISDRTPWRGLADKGAGWDLPLDDVEAFRRVIDACACEPAAVRAARARAAMALVDELDADLGVVERTAQLLGLSRDPLRQRAY